MSFQEPRKHRLNEDGAYVRGGTDRLPPYSGPGEEPSDQVANEWISAADHPGEHATSDITTDDIIPQQAQQAPKARRVSQAGDSRDRANVDYDASEADAEDTANNRGTMATFTEKDGGYALPVSVPRDPASPGVGPFSRAIVAIIVLVLLLILVAVIVSLL